MSKDNYLYWVQQFNNMINDHHSLYLSSLPSFLQCLSLQDSNVTVVAPEIATSNYCIYNQKKIQSSPFFLFLLEIKSLPEIIPHRKFPLYLFDWCWVIYLLVTQSLPNEDGLPCSLRPVLLHMLALGEEYKSCYVESHCYHDCFGSLWNPCWDCHFYSLSLISLCCKARGLELDWS